MANVIESRQFIDSYNILTENSFNFNISIEDFDNYISLLKYNILQKIEDTHRVPMYAFKMILNELLSYQNIDDNGYTFDLMCKFEPLEDKLPDLILDNSYILPSSARSTFNTFNGENITTISWKEYFVKNTD